MITFTSVRRADRENVWKDVWEVRWATRELIGGGVPATTYHHRGKFKTREEADAFAKKLYETSPVLGLK